VSHEETLVIQLQLNVPCMHNQIRKPGKSPMEQKIMIALDVMQKSPSFTGFAQSLEEALIATLEDRLAADENIKDVSGKNQNVPGRKPVIDQGQQGSIGGVFRMEDVQVRDDIQSHPDENALYQNF
jgi:hypothetical protein